MARVVPIVRRIIIFKKAQLKCTSPRIVIFSKKAQLKLAQLNCTLSVLGQLHGRSNSEHSKSIWCILPNDLFQITKWLAKKVIPGKLRSLKRHI